MWGGSDGAGGREGRGGTEVTRGNSVRITGGKTITKVLYAVEGKNRVN